MSSFSKYNICQRHNLNLINNSIIFIPNGHMLFISSIM